MHFNVFWLSLGLILFGFWRGSSSITLASMAVGLENSERFFDGLLLSGCHKSIYSTSATWCSHFSHEFEFVPSNCERQIAENANTYFIADVIKSRKEFRFIFYGLQRRKGIRNTILGNGYDGTSKANNGDFDNHQ